jgi:hypothetical protein
MTAKTANLTPARRKALNTLATARSAGRSVRVSNETNESAVYWQSADWLVGEGLAYVTTAPDGVHIQLTDAGRHVAGAL